MKLFPLHGSTPSTDDPESFVIHNDSISRSDVEESDSRGSTDVIHLNPREHYLESQILYVSQRSWARTE